MRQKLALTAAFQHDPALLILDEPTDGLDPLIQRGFEELLRDLRDRGRTIFMSSHDLAEVERTCERVAVVRGGRLVAEETVEGLKRLQRRTIEVTFAGETPPELALVPGGDDRLPGRPPAPIGPGGGPEPAAPVPGRARCGRSGLGPAEAGGRLHGVLRGGRAWPGRCGTGSGAVPDPAERDLAVRR